MRLPIAAALALLTACSGSPRPTPEVMPEVAAEFVAIHNSWDEARFSALFATGNPGRSPRMREHLAWLREQLGACGEPELLWPTSKRGARWTHTCEHGALETWFKLDEAGQIVDMSSGAVGLPLPPGLLPAATNVIASLPWPAGAVRPFQHNLGGRLARSLGHCTLVKPWVFGRDRALFHLRCDHDQPAVFGIVLNPDGAIVRANFLDAELYRVPPETSTQRSPGELLASK